MAKTLHFAMNDHAVDGYVMFSYFSFRDGNLHIGQCQSVRLDQVAACRDALERSGWTKGDYRYVNGKAVLVEG